MKSKSAAVVAYSGESAMKLWMSQQYITKVFVIFFNSRSEFFDTKEYGNTLQTKKTSVVGKIYSE